MLRIGRVINRLALRMQRLQSPFLDSVFALAAQSKPPKGLWLSVLSRDPVLLPKTDIAEFIVLKPGEDWQAGVKRAQAPYILKLEAGCRLTPYALEQIASTLTQNPDVDCLYTDEIGAGDVILKPAFDPVLLDSFDYFGSGVVYKRDRLLGFDAAGISRYEIALRFAHAESVLHLPYPTIVGPGGGADISAAKAALQHVRGVGGFAPSIEADRLRPCFAPLSRRWPCVSIIIPSKDAPHLISKVLAGLFMHTDYPDLDVMIIDNGTTDPATLALYKNYAQFPLRVEIRPGDFNFSAAVNRGAALARSDVLLLLNNDVEILEPGWLKEMVSCLAYPHTGIVGAKLLYPDGRLQHAGVIAGLGGYAGHWYGGCDERELGPQRRLASRQRFSIVTGACMLISRACFQAIGGFDAAAFPVAYNDVDFCLRADRAGYHTLWTPFARLIHRESATRGSDELAVNRARFAGEKAALQARHNTHCVEDRAYSPWGRRDCSYLAPVARSTLPLAR